MAQAVSRLPQQKTGFDPKSVHVRLVIDGCAQRLVSLPRSSDYSCQYPSTIAPYSSACTLCTFQKTNGHSLGTIKNAVVLLKFKSVE